MSPLRRVQSVKSNADCYGMEMLSDSPHGDHVLLTVEEYRERIEQAYGSGFVSGRSKMSCEAAWSESFTKQRLDEEVG